MRTPLKRPITLRRNFVYLLKKGTVVKTHWFFGGRKVLKKPTKAIYCHTGSRSNLPYFRLQRRRSQFVVLYANRNVVKRLREKTDNE